MIKAIIFDLDDTLYEYSKLNDEGIEKIAEYVYENLKIEKSEFYKAFNTAKETIKQQLTERVASSHNRMLYCQKTLENLGKNPFLYALEMYETYWGHILENMKLNRNVLEVFEFCKKNDIKIGICTDLTVHIQHRKIRKLGIHKYIDAIITSEEVGIEKPDFKIYEEILKKLEIKSAEALFIGDNLNKDVLGPLKYGMNALWYSKDSNDKCKSIQNFNEVLEILKNGEFE